MLKSQGGGGNVRVLLQRIEFLRRHFVPALPYITVRKLLNLALNELEFRGKKTELASFPPFIKLESTPMCHLKCPGCVHGDPVFKKTLNNRMKLALDLVKEIVYPISDKLIGVSLSYSGEPLLNKELIPVVNYLHRLNIYTSFPSNLSVPMSSSQAEDIIRSGLDVIMVSLDGATAQSYNKYRVGGNFDLVLRNVGLIAETKHRLCSSTPKLLWKYVIFAHNEQEVPTVKARYRELGFDGYEFDHDHGGEHVAAAKHSIDERARNAPRPCFWAWNTTVIGWDGDIQPCCKQMGKISLGNAGIGGLGAVWNSETYRSFRASFLKKDGRDMHPVCRECMGVQMVN